MKPLEHFHAKFILLLFHGSPLSGTLSVFFACESSFLYLALISFACLYFLTSLSGISPR